jgi:hypothetical protein
MESWPTEESTRKIKKFMWMFNKGQATMRTRLDKSAYSVNESIKIWVDVDNLHCSSRITEIQVSLRRHYNCGKTFLNHQ